MFTWSCKINGVINPHPAPKRQSTNQSLFLTEGSFAGHYIATTQVCSQLPFLALVSLSEESLRRHVVVAEIKQVVLVYP